MIISYSKNLLRKILTIFFCYKNIAIIELSAIMEGGVLIKNYHQQER